MQFTGSTIKEIGHISRSGLEIVTQVRLNFSKQSVVLHTGCNTATENPFGKDAFLSTALTRLMFSYIQGRLKRLVF